MAFNEWVFSLLILACLLGLYLHLGKVNRRTAKEAEDKLSLEYDELERRRT